MNNELSARAALIQQRCGFLDASPGILRAIAFIELVTGVPAEEEFVAVPEPETWSPYP